MPTLTELFWEGVKLEPLYDGHGAVLDFEKYQLSIVQHSHSYGGKQGLYEIAVYNGNQQMELPGITAEGDTVKGYLTIEDVAVIIKKMHTITGVSHKQKLGSFA